MAGMSSKYSLEGTTIYKLDVKNVPVDAFWSVSLYNAVEVTGPTASELMLRSNG